MKNSIFCILIAALCACNSKPQAAERINVFAHLCQDYNKIIADTADNDSLLPQCIYDMQQYVSKHHGSFGAYIDNVSYNLFVADLNLHNINLHLYKPKTTTNFSTVYQVRQHLIHSGEEICMITNAGMFNPQYKPVGLYIEEGKAPLFPLDTLNIPNGGNFYLQPNGVFYVDSNNAAHIVTTQSYSKNPPKVPVKLATQSGPMLVLNNTINEAFSPTSANKQIRSGVGIINNKKAVFVCSSTPCTFYEFANFFKTVLGCSNALYLDGAISKMYPHGLDTNGNFGPILSVTKK